MKERPAITSSLTADGAVSRGDRSRTRGGIFGDIIMICYGLSSNIDNVLPMVRKRISPTPDSTISANKSNHVTDMMHGRALVYFRIAAKYSNGRF